MSKKVSIIIPSRRERWLAQTIDDLRKNAQGDIEIIAVLDGYWPDPSLPDYPNLVILHRNKCLGMRPSINMAARIARGDYRMKIDGHCMVDYGFDEKLKADCEDDWLIVPRRYSLNVEDWAIAETGKAPVDYHYLSWPYSNDAELMNNPGGMHGNVWLQRAKERKDVLIDDEMSSQGSSWFTTKKHWQRILEPMDIEHYGTFRQEFQELGNKTWLSGGRVVINKKTWYAHLHKGRKHGYGYGFSNARWAQWARESELGRLYCIDFWMNDKPFKNKVHSLEWLIDKFWPVPTWPEDWKSIVKPDWPKNWVNFQDVLKELE